MSTLILLCLTALNLAQQEQEGHVLFYYRQDKDSAPGFLKQMRHDVATAHARLVKQQAIDRATLDPQVALQRAFAMALASRVEEMNCEACENANCREHQAQLDNPCVEIGFDAVKQMCKVVYKCKIVDIGDAQRTVAPLDKAEAERDFRARRTGAI
jgi:hypothetical protein